MTTTSTHDSDKLDFIYSNNSTSSESRPLSSHSRILKSNQPKPVKIKRAKPRLKSARPGDRPNPHKTGGYNPKNIHPENIKIDLWNKPFVGGYIDKRTNLHYHDCGIQSPFKPKYKDRPKSYHRNIQTTKTANFKQQTNHTIHTQMDRSDLLLDHSKDKTVSDSERIFDENQYITSKQQKLKKIDSAITIQCALRSHFAKTKVNELKAERENKIKENIDTLQKEQRLLEKQRKLLEYKRNNPQHSREFKQIINTMTTWNNKQLHDTLKNKAISRKLKANSKNKMIYEHSKELRNLQQRQLKTQQKQKKLRKQNLLNAVKYKL